MDLSQLVAPDQNQPPKRYDEVLDTYNKAKSMFPEDFGTMDVPTFAGHMNRITGTQDYAAGEGPDNWIRRASGNITHELHHFGGEEGTSWPKSFPSLSELVGGPRSGIDLPEASRSGAETATRALGGGPELQKKVGGFGASVPRMAFDIGVPALLTAPIGGVGAIPGMAGLSAASTYEETGSKTAAGISGAAGLLFPKAAEYGGQTLLKAIGAPTLGEMGPELLAKARGLLGDKAATDLAKGTTRFATTIPEKTAKLVGSQVGMATTALGTEAAQIGVRSDEDWHQKVANLGEMFSPSSLVVTALNQVPWTGIEAWHERGQPIAKITAAIEPRMRQDFADRYVAAYKEKVGVEPSIAQVKQATDVAAGTVLASKQFGVDTTRPLRTSDGEWNPLEAVDSVKKVANSIALATPDLNIRVDQQHDPRIIIALRDIEASSGGKMNQDDMAREAALRVVHNIRTDSDMIGRVSPEYAELIRSSNDLAAKTEKENEVNKQINQRIDPNNANFDSELARRIAAVSGTPQDREDVGLPPLGLSTRDPENPQAFTPLDRNIIDTIRGKRNVVTRGADEEQQLDFEDQRSLLTDRLASVQESIKTKETATPPELHQSDSELEDLHVEEARTLQMLEQLAEPTTVEGTTRGEILTGDQSFAANEAALNYPKEVNWNDPRSVRSFYEYTKGAVRKAEIDWSRNTATETTVSRHPTLEAAQTEAKNLSASDPSGQVKYFTRNRPAKDGTFAVYKQDYSSTLSLNREDEGRVGESDNAITRALNKEQVEKFEMGGIPKSVFDALGEVEKELAKNEVQESFDKLNRMSDLGTREGYKAGFAQNVIDFISSLPESKLDAVLRSGAKEPGTRSVRDIAFRKAQYIKFVQFLRDGGQVGLKTIKNKDGSVSVRPTGDLTAMNNYFGSLGYDPTRLHNMTPFVDVGKVRGMNFFEQFHVLTKLLKKELADPRWSEQRPLGDYGFIPRGFYEKLEDKLTYDWPNLGRPPVGRPAKSINMWKDIPDVLEGDVLKMNDRKGNVKRLEVKQNPLLAAIVKGAKQKLTLSSGRLVELMEQSGHDLDPELLQLAKALTDAPFGKNIQVGFGLAKDPNAKGYYHYDTDALIGTGILLSPFSASSDPKFVRSVDSPKGILPHLVHELAHAHTVFGYHNDPEVKALVDETYNYVKQRHTDLMSVTKDEGFLQDTLHGLVSPQEMLATVFHDPQMMQFLKGIKDPFEPLPDQSEANLFGRVMAIVKRVFAKLLGSEGAGTMLQRVQQLATQAMARTEQIGGFRHEGDIYGRVEANVLREGDVLRSPTPQKPGLLESRTSNSLPLIDSMKAYSDHLVEEPDKYFFKPTDQPTFAKVFGPVLGQSNFVRRSGVWGYEVPKASLEAVTPEQISQMPPPKVGMWAPSSFEALKTIFSKNGDSDQSAEAKAGWTMRFANLLRNNDETTWSVLSDKQQRKGELSNAAGVAWMPDKKVGLATKITSPPYLARVVAHEATHTFGASEERAWEPQEVRDAMDQVEKTFTGLSDLERRSVLMGLVNLSNIAQGGGAHQLYERALKQPVEFVSEFMAHTADVLVRAPKPNAYMQEALRLVPDDMSNLLQRVTLARATSLSALDNYIDRSSFMYGIKSDKPLDVVHELSAMFKGFAKSALETANDQAEFYRMRLMYPDSYQTLLNASQGLQPDTGLLLESKVPGAAQVRRALGLEQDSREPTKPSFWNRFIGTFTGFVSTYPIARPFYDMLAASAGLSHARKLQLDTALAGSASGAKIVDDVRTKQVATFAKSAKLQDVFSKIALQMQLDGDAKFDEALAAANGDPKLVPQINVATPEYMAAAYKKYGVSPDEQKSLETVFNGTRNQIIMTSANIVQGHIEMTKGLAAKAVQMHTDLRPEEARRVAGLANDAWAKADVGDMQGSVDAQNEFNAAVPDATVRSLVSTMIQEGRETSKDLEAFLTARMPYFMSERRPGGYAVWWKDDAGVMRREYFKNHNDRSKYIQSKDIQPVKLINPDDKNFGLDDKFFGQLDTVQAKMVERLKETFGEQEGSRLATLMDLSSELRSAMGAQSALSTMAKREHVETREGLNMFGVHQAYISSVVNALKARHIRLEQELLLGAKEFDNQPVIKDMLQKRTAAFLAPDTEIGKSIQAVNFIYYMGGNISSMLLHGFQQFQSLAPTLIKNGDTVSGAFSRLKNANTMVLQNRFGKTKYDAELGAAVARAKAERVLEFGPTTEFDHSTDLALANRMRVTQGGKEFGVFDMMKNRVFQAADLARRFYTPLLNHNSEASFVAGYLQAREQGMNPNDAFSQARFVKNETMFGGGKFDRPGFFGAMNVDSYGIGRTAAQSMWSLQTYETGMISLMGNLIKQSLHPKGLTPAQAVQVRKAAATMLTVQMTLAGTLGLPFVGAGLALLQKMFPDLQPELAVKDFLNNIAGDDSAMGGFFGSALATGIPSALDQAPDLGSRYALTGVLGASPYSGITVQDMLGPTGSMIKNVLAAAQAGARGDAPKVVENLAPRSFVRMWKALAQGNTFESNATGDQLVGDLSPAERLGRFIGYTPARVARIQEGEKLARIAEQVEKHKDQAFASEQADALRSPGGEVGVRQAIEQRADASKGVKKSETLAKSVADAYEKKTLPQDPRNIGNTKTLDENRALMGLLGNQRPGPTQSDRLAVQQEVLARLGIGRVSGGQVRRASLLDQLLAQYPGLTTPEASLLLPSKRGATDPQSLGLLTPSALLQ